MAEETRQETVRILKNSSRRRDNLSKTETAALNNLRNNTELTILPADKGNTMVVLNTTDYKQKISTLLEDPAYRRLAKDPTTTIERKTTLLLKKLHSPKRHGDNWVQPVPDLQDYTDCPRYTRKEFHWDQLWVTLAPPHTNFPSTWQDFLINSLVNQYIMLKFLSTSSIYFNHYKSNRVILWSALT